MKTAIAPFLAGGARVSRDQFEALLAEGSVLETRKRTGAAKVISIPRPGAVDLFIKAWHPKRTLTSARLHPYDLRFRNNAAKLRNLGFSAPVVRGWGAVGFDGTRFISYEALPGHSLRSLAPEVDLTGTATFIAGIHEAGVDFRSLHLGNILWAGGDEYGLIDLTDCRFHGRPLTLRRRAGRLIYLCTHKRDLAFMATDERWVVFLDAYCRAAGAELEELQRHASRHAGWAALGRAAA